MAITTSCLSSALAPIRTLVEICNALTNFKGVLVRTVRRSPLREALCGIVVEHHRARARLPLGIEALEIQRLPPHRVPRPLLLRRSQSSSSHRHVHGRLCAVLLLVELDRGRLWRGGVDALGWYVRPVLPWAPEGEDVAADAAVRREEGAVALRTADVALSGVAIKARNRARVCVMLLISSVCHRSTTQRSTYARRELLLQLLEVARGKRSVLVEHVDWTEGKSRAVRRSRRAARREQ